MSFDVIVYDKGGEIVDHTRLPLNFYTHYFRDRGLLRPLMWSMEDEYGHYIYDGERMDDLRAEVVSCLVGVDTFSDESSDMLRAILRCIEVARRCGGSVEFIGD